MRQLFRVPVTAVAAFLLLGRADALAEQPAYCRKVHALAASDAALLMAPQVVVQGIRHPSSNAIDIGATAGDGYQVRTALSFSPLDFYKGLRVMRLGDAECDLHESSMSIEEILDHGAGAARLVALREQEAYLDAHDQEWRALMKKAEERFSERVITLIDLNEVRNHADALERKLAHVRGEVAQLAAQRLGKPRGSLSAQAAAYARSANRVAREASYVRSLDAWRVRVVSGVIPFPRSDWYGLAEVSFNIGGIAQSIHEDRHLGSRAEELQHASYEVNQRLRRFRDQTRAAIEQARNEVEAVEREISFIVKVRSVLESSDAQGIAHTRDTLALQQLSVDAERVFLRALIEALSTYTEDRPQAVE
ncbi:hypothetical protein WMF39_22675 [Sorangium sp. So ce1504]|uniref:hypothetical protein n=1 Tax=Sorangium sp. So ce1504 TaxID=3133337 RepID=UPI003F5ED741